MSHQKIKTRTQTRTRFLKIEKNSDFKKNRFLKSSKLELWLWLDFPKIVKTRTFYWSGNLQKILTRHMLGLTFWSVEKLILELRLTFSKYKKLGLELELDFENFQKTRTFDSLNFQWFEKNSNFSKNSQKVFLTHSTGSWA